MKTCPDTMLLLLVSRIHSSPWTCSHNSCLRSILHHGSRQSLRARHVHRLHVAVQLLLCAFLVISLPRDSNAQSVGHAFDTGLPDFLVQLGVEADVFGSLFEARLWLEDVLVVIGQRRWRQRHRGSGDQDDPSSKNAAIE